MKLVYEYKEKNPEVSWRKIGEEFHLQHPTVKGYYNKYKAKLEKEKNNEETPKINGLNELPEEIEIQEIKENKEEI